MLYSSRDNPFLTQEMIQAAIDTSSNVHVKMVVEVNPVNLKLIVTSFPILTFTLFSIGASSVVFDCQVELNGSSLAGAHSASKTNENAADVEFGVF